MSQILHSLYWLPIRQRVTIKIALLVWKCVHGAAPAYLQELCVPVEDVRGRPRLRCIRLPRVRTSTDSEVLRSVSRQFGRFAINFAVQEFVAESVQWQLKTYLFCRGQ